MSRGRLFHHVVTEFLTPRLIQDLRRLKFVRSREYQSAVVCHVSASLHPLRWETQEENQFPGPQITNNILTCARKKILRCLSTTNWEAGK